MDGEVGQVVFSGIPLRISHRLFASPFAGERVGLIFDRVNGRGFVVLWLSRLSLSADRARQSSTLESGIEIASHPSCSVFTDGCIVHRRGSLHGLGCRRGYWFQRLHFGRGTDRGAVRDTDTDSCAADGSAD